MLSRIADPYGIADTYGIALETAQNALLKPGMRFDVDLALLLQEQVE